MDISGGLIMQPRFVVAVPVVVQMQQRPQFPPPNHPMAFNPQHMPPPPMMTHQQLSQPFGQKDIAAPPMKDMNASSSKEGPPIVLPGTQDISQPPPQTAGMVSHSSQYHQYYSARPPHYAPRSYGGGGGRFPSQYRHSSSLATASGTGGTDPKLAGGPMSSFDGKQLRTKTMTRKTVDYSTSVVNYLESRLFSRDQRDQRDVHSDAVYSHLMLPPGSLIDKPMNGVTTKFVRAALNKLKSPIFSLCWTPEGRRLVTGAASGEFTLWNGLTFNFETILQAHDTAVRAMVWSHNDTWMLTGDHAGFVKYWQTNMNNVKMYQAHKDPIRGLRWAQESLLPPVTDGAAGGQFIFVRGSLSVFSVTLLKATLY